MKQDNTKPLGEVLKEYIKELQLSGKLNEVRLIRKWEEIIGKTIARSTNKIYIKDNILHIYIRSSIIKNELVYIKTALIAKVNQELTDYCIKDIILH